MDPAWYRSNKPLSTDVRLSAVAAPSRPAAGARERLGMAALAIERARRGTIARMRRSRLLRWRHRAPIADDLLLAPPDLRPQDPTFVEEMDAGGFGLCGFAAQLRGESPFAVRPPAELWARELHGFGWLRHCSAGWTLDNDGTARRLVRDWIAGKRRHGPLAWAPEVVSRRLLSWLSYAALILPGADRRTYASILLSLEDQVTYLSATWRNAPEGAPKLLALIGLTQTALCIAGHERRLPMAERPLSDELERQILSDGGHISRNSQVLMELLLDLLPLRQCFVARGLEPNAAVSAAIERMIAMLHHLRLGDGHVARFNGMGATERDSLATVLAYGNQGPQPSQAVPPSGYVRLQRGSSVVLVDAAPPPPLGLAGRACAGCLSFEMSIGGELLAVNGGAPAAAHAAFASAARSTASHNTLELGGQSSSRLVRGLGVDTGASAPIQRPDRVTCDVREEHGDVVLSATHDGYVDRFNLVHSRTLKLRSEGRRLEGVDQLDGARGDVRFSWDVPFAIHFHLHPHCRVRSRRDGSAEIALMNGESWCLEATGAALTIEDSTHYAEVIGPVVAQQIVLRGVCYGAAEVRWVLERIEAPGAMAERHSALEND